MLSSNVLTIYSNILEIDSFFDTAIFLTWTEFSRGFFFLIEQKEMLVDRQFAGVVITPMDTHLMAAIVGLYFGGSLVKK